MGMLDAIKANLKAASKDVREALFLRAWDKAHRGDYECRQKRRRRERDLMKFKEAQGNV